MQHKIQDKSLAEFKRSIEAIYTQLTNKPPQHKPDSYWQRKYLEYLSKKHSLKSK